MDSQLEKLLTHAFKSKASDIHITSNKSPIFRIHGELKTLKGPHLEPSDTERMARTLMNHTEWGKFQELRELDFASSIEGVARFRVNAYYQQETISLALRIISSTIPDFADLKLPSVIEGLTNITSGLVLVTGPTGSGKSSTLAAMIDLINKTQKKHIITLEDPVEFIHTNAKSLIDQREVGNDTLSFANGLRASLRQDPDVILVGELRDLETIATAVTAAETGHLVLGTVHTNGAVSTIERIIDMFPSGQQSQIRLQVAATLRSVVSQQLLPLSTGKGRRAVTEVLINTPAIANNIKEGKTSQIPNVLQTSKHLGMHTLEMAIDELSTEGVVDNEVLDMYRSSK